MSRHRGANPIRVWLSWGLIASGLLLLAYSAWTYLFEDIISSESKKSKALEYSVSATVEEPKDAFVDVREAKPSDVIGRMVVPKLGDDFVRLIGEGTKWNPVLNEIGIGHYLGTAMPGEVGNFATAAHRGGFGGTYRNVHRLTKGDKVYVQTNDGWYTYDYRQTKIVKPEQVEVIADVPGGMDGAKIGGRYLTMTSCDPVWVNTERIIVWFELETFTPTSEPEPEAVRWVATK